MFYSTDILSRRKGGSLGILWLSATLGSKGGSAFKKLSRKEILGVNLVSACEKLASPEEPFALRLSSNLLCGIARVYQQQGSKATSPSDKHKVKDLATITLHEPHIDDYLLQDNDDPAMRMDDGLGGEAFIIGEDEPGLLEGMSPELDALLQVGSEAARARSRAGSGASGPRYGASSSAQGGDMGGMYGDDFGGMDDLDGPRQDYGDVAGFDLGDQMQAIGNETYEERVRREHEEAAAQRSGLVAGPRASSVDQQQDVEFSPGGTVASSNKRKSGAMEGADLALPAPAQPKRSPKKLKHITIDSEISLTDEQVKQARAGYSTRMERERAKAEKAKLDKEGGARAVDLLFDPPEGFGGALADFWKSTVSDQLVRPGEGRAAAEKKRKALEKDGQAAKKRKSDEGDVEIGRSGNWGLFGDPAAGDWQLGNDFNAGKDFEVPLNDQDLGGMDDEIRYDDIDEYGRAASQGALTGSGKENFPWNEEVVTSDAGAGFIAGGASSQGGTAKVSLDTPLKPGDKRRSRTGSLVPSALGSGRAGSEALVGGDFEEFQLDEEGLVSQEASQPNAEVLATKLEHDSLKFLSFANRKALARPEEELLFSDIVPVASTSNAAAAAAFYHLLALATRGDIKVEQGEPYGEIAVEIVVEV